MFAGGAGIGATVGVAVLSDTTSREQARLLLDGATLDMVAIDKAVSDIRATPIDAADDDPVWRSKPASPARRRTSIAIPTCLPVDEFGEITG